MQIDINTLAPWVAIAVTLILSILVPVFSQMANNRFQLKKAKQDRKLDEEREKYSKKIEAFENFLMDVGAATEYRSKDNVAIAGASIGRIYLYVPVEWHSKLDALHYSLYECEWGKAQKQYIEIAKLVVDEYRKIDNNPSKQK